MIKEIKDINYINNLSNYKVTLNPFNKVIGYYINDILVGFLDYSVMYEKIEINYIFVINEYRRKSIAYNLIKYVVDNYDFENITLEVNVNNVSAINLINIKKVGKRRNNMQWFKVPAKIYFERNISKGVLAAPQFAILKPSFPRIKYVTSFCGESPARSRAKNIITTPESPLSIARK